MLKTILAATGALCTFGGLLLVLAYMQVRYELRQARRKEHPMVRRYCGEVTVYITYLEDRSEYQCRVTTPEAHDTVYVGEPSVLQRAVDHPIAYDEVAHAALSFVDEGSEGGTLDVASYADICSPDGSWLWAITRKPRPGTRHSLEARAKVAVDSLLAR